MAAVDPTDRFAFGRNWENFLDKHFDADRLESARKHLMIFLGRSTLEGLTFLDIGSGSGLHSLAAFRAGAAKVISFDYDSHSVAATRRLHALAGNPANWTIQQGSVLDPDFMTSLPQADIVYSWGVLHHTGAQWTALRHALGRLSEQGELYIALYTADAFIDPSPDKWLRLKQRYNQSGPIAKAWQEWDYIYNQLAKRSLAGLWKTVDYARTYRSNRGMSLMVDIRDWLGGWPMEFSTMREVMDLCCGEYGLHLQRLDTGEANNEYLFTRQRRPDALSPHVQEIRDLAELDGLEEIHIYGAGLGGRILLDLLRSRGGPRVVGFIDAFAEGEQDGLPILNLKTETAGLSRDTPILVSLAQFGKVVPDLMSLGFRNLINGNPIAIAERRRRG